MLYKRQRRARALQEQQSVLQREQSVEEQEGYTHEPGYSPAIIRPFDSYDGSMQDRPLPYTSEGWVWPLELDGRGMRRWLSVSARPRGGRRHGLAPRVQLDEKSKSIDESLPIPAVVVHSH